MNAGGKVPNSNSFLPVQLSSTPQSKSYYDLPYGVNMQSNKFISKNTVQASAARMNDDRFKQGLPDMRITRVTTQEKDFIVQQSKQLFEELNKEYMDDMFAESGDETAKFGVSQVRNDFDKC